MAISSLLCVQTWQGQYPRYQRNRIRVVRAFHGRYCRHGSLLHHGRARPNILDTGCVRYMRSGHSNAGVILQHGYSSFATQPTYRGKAPILLGGYNTTQEVHFPSSQATFGAKLSTGKCQRFSHLAIFNSVSSKALEDFTDKLILPQILESSENVFCYHDEIFFVINTPDAKIIYSSSVESSRQICTISKTLDYTGLAIANENLILSLDQLVQGNYYKNHDGF